MGDKLINKNATTGAKERGHKAGVTPPCKGGARGGCERKRALLSPWEMKRVDETLTRDARDLRNNATHAERVLWRLLSRYRPRFTRQLVVSSYIVDLACREAKVAIEVDGGQHGKTLVYDARRTAFHAQSG
ncbi:MAG: DUF559 domain-containing protein [Sphingomonadales bacterium]|nr:DUF559 domain-containing protein [Sphingomonadales bacterium]